MTDGASGVDEQQHYQQRGRERHQRPLRFRLCPDAGRTAGGQAPLRGAQACEEGRCRSKQRFYAAQRMNALHVYAAGSGDEGCTIVAGSGITRRNIDTNHGRLGCVCSTRWGPVLDV